MAEQTARSLLTKIPSATTREEAEREKLAFQAWCSKRGLAEVGGGLDQELLAEVAHGIEDVNGVRLSRHGEISRRSVSTPTRLGAEETGPDDFYTGGHVDDLVEAHPFCPHYATPVPRLTTSGNL